MKLTKIQFYSIKEELISIEQEINIIQTGLLDYSPTYGINMKEINDPIDYTLIGRKAMLEKRKEELKQLLENAQIISISKSDVIELGSRFKVRFDDGDEEIFTIVDAVGYEKSPDEYVSSTSLFAQSVLGLRESDTFSFQANESIVSGTIQSIIKKIPKQKVKK